MFLVYAMSFTAAISMNTLGPVLSIYAHDYVGATVEEVGIIISICAIASMFSKFISGFYCHGMRGLYLMVGGLLLAAACPIVMILSPTPQTMIISSAIWGFSTALTWPSMLTFVVLLTTNPQHVREAISNYSLSTSIGMFIAPLIDSIGIVTIGMRNTLILTAIILIISFLLGSMLIHSRADLSQNLSKEGGGRPSLRAIPHIFANRSFRFVAIALVTMAFVYSTVLAYGTLYAENSFHVGEGEVPLLYFGYYGVLMVTRLLVRRSTKIVSDEKIMVLSLANCTIATLLLVLSSNYITFALVFSILGASHALLFPVGAIILAESTAQDLLPLANAVYAITWDFGNILGPSMTAPLVTSYTYREALVTTSFVSALGLVTMTLLRRRWKTLKDN